MNAFTRMFYEPNAKPPRLSASRLASIPLTGVGIVWLALWSVADLVGLTLTIPWWAGLALICAGAMLYAVNKFSAGPVSVEFSGDVQNVNVTEAKPEPKE